MKFILNTDSVSQSATEINNISQKVQSIMDSCNGYSVDNSDGIDFSGAKSVLAANLSACSERMKASSTIINEITNQHTELQNKLTFENYLNPPADQEEKENKDGDDAYPGDNGYPGDSGSPYGRGPSSQNQGNFVHAFQTETTPITEEKQAYSAVLAALVAGQIGKQRDTAISNVSYANILPDKLSLESKEVLSTQDKDDNSGYIKINGRYVIACSNTVGKTGEVLRFTATDGSIVECVVGANTVTKENKDKVFLLVNKTEGVTPVDLNNIIAKDNTKVETIGIYTDKNIENKSEQLGSNIETPSDINNTGATTNENAETNTTTDNNSGEVKGDISTGGGISA